MTRQLTLIAVAIICLLRAPLVEAQTPDASTALSHDVLIKKIVERLDSADPEERTKAAVVLKETALREDIPRLVPLLRGGNSLEKQIAIVETLEKLADERAAPALKFEFEEGLPEAKPFVISALGKLGSNWPVPLLARTMESKDVDVAKRAASALGFIRTQKSRYALTEVLASRKISGAVKAAAEWALKVSQQEIDQTIITENLPAGRKTTNYFLGTEYYLYHPTHRPRVDEWPWLLVCVHGGNLAAEALFDRCHTIAKQQRMAALVVYFNNMQFPGYETFNVKGERSDKRLLAIIDHVVKIAELRGEELYMYGQGDGAAFATRFAMAYPARIAKVALDATTYFPELDKIDVHFPVGWKKSILAPDISPAIRPFIKNNIGYILSNSDEKREKDAERFVETVNRYSRLTGISNNIAVRSEFGGKVDQTVSKYLFGPN